MLLAGLRLAGHKRTNAPATWDCSLKAAPQGLGCRGYRVPGQVSHGLGVWDLGGLIFATPKGNPATLSSELAKLGSQPTDAHGDSDPQLKLLNTLKDNFPHVAAASYDYLSEVNCSIAAFLVCS